MASSPQKAIYAALAANLLIAATKFVAAPKVIGPNMP